jgi:predicted anti-sigma-YlaC factor YlaD
MMSCKQAVEAIASDGTVGAGFFARLGLRFHFFLCRHCRRYAAQIRSLGAETRCLCEDEPALTPQARQAILDACFDTSSSRAPAEPKQPDP